MSIPSQPESHRRSAAKPRIAHLAGSTATIQNTPPLVTANKARARAGLPLRPNPDGTPARFDALRPQRLAAPATVYVEAFSAHPLEADAAELYAAPDGFVGGDGAFHRERRSESDKPVHVVELSPEDGLYPLPYMALQADGSAWDEECASPGASEARARQPFFPDGSRSFEEIDRLSVTAEGVANPLSALADIDFFRIMPPGGYTKGLPTAARPDVGDGDIAPERRGAAFFPYRPVHLAAEPPRPALATLTNRVQAVASSGAYAGLVWTQGSPQVEETAYWFNLLIDTTLPICCNAAQRPHGQVSNDGPQNLIHSVQLIASRAWADEAGRNRLGTLVIQEQQYFAAREVMKADARPGGYIATGGHGGIVGGVTHAGAIKITYLPAYRHTDRSAVNLSRLPGTVPAVRREGAAIVTRPLAIKDPAGQLLEAAIPSVSIVKDGGYAADDYGGDPALELDLIALIEVKLGLGRLAGLVVEGLAPYGNMPSRARALLTARAVFSGLPVVRVGRGSPEGFADPHPFYIAGSNLTATKARLLLMACLMKFGSLPSAHDPDRPTAEERARTIEAVRLYQEIFDSH